MRVFVPRDAAARALGADAVAAAVARPRRRGAGSRSSWCATASRGMVWLEPLVEVETDGGADGLRAGGGGRRRRARSTPGFGAHPLALGPVEAIPFFARQTRLTFARCGLIDPLSLAEYEAHGGLAGLRRALAMDGQAIVDEVTASGLRGRGGAGFPTGIKWDTVAARRRRPQKYVVCNADEGDSGTFADRMIMEGDPFVLIEGMAIAGIGVGATKGYVYIRSEYPDAIEVMQRGDRHRAGGGAARARRCSARGAPSTWRCGSAPGPMSAARRRACSNSLEGKRGGGAGQAAAAGDRGAVRPADGGQQRDLARHGAGDLREGRGLLPGASASAGRAGRSRSRSPATCASAGSSRPPSA